MQAVKLLAPSTVFYSVVVSNRGWLLGVNVDSNNSIYIFPLGTSRTHLATYILMDCLERCSGLLYPMKLGLDRTQRAFRGLIYV